MQEDEQQLVEEAKDYYLRVWSAIFKEFRGWTPEQTQQWAFEKGYLGLSEGRDFWTLHDPVAKCPAWELLPAQLKDDVRDLDVKALLDMGWDACEALWSLPYGADPSEAAWTTIRRNFEAVVTRYEKLVRDQNTT